MKKVIGLFICLWVTGLYAAPVPITATCSQEPGYQPLCTCPYNFKDDAIDCELPSTYVSPGALITVEILADTDFSSPQNYLDCQTDWANTQFLNVLPLGTAFSIKSLASNKVQFSMNGNVYVNTGLWFEMATNQGFGMGIVCNLY